MAAVNLGSVISLILTILSTKVIEFLWLPEFIH